MIAEAFVASVTPLLSARTIASETTEPFVRWIVWLYAIALLPPTVAFVLGEAIAPYLMLGAIAAVATAIALVDLRERIIPDILVVALAAIAFIAPFRPSLVDQVVGALVLGLLFLGVRTAYFTLRGQEGLGLGDVKLAIVIGALLGAERALAATGYGAAVTAICVLICAHAHAKTNDVDAAPAIEAPLGIGLSGALVAACAFVVIR